MNVGLSKKFVLILKENLKVGFFFNKKKHKIDKWYASIDMFLVNCVPYFQKIFRVNYSSILHSSRKVFTTLALFGMALLCIRCKFSPTLLAHGSTKYSLYDTASKKSFGKFRSVLAPTVQELHTIAVQQDVLPYLIFSTYEVF